MFRVVCARLTEQTSRSPRDKIRTVTMTMFRVAPDRMLDFFLPRTDSGAAVQLVGAGVVYGSLAFVVRRNRDLLLFVAGLAVMTVAWFALRTAH